MNGIVIVFGSFLLFVLATGIGMLIAGEQQRIQRLRLAKRGWELYNWEQELINLAELDGCPSCRLLRRRAELQHRPPDAEAA
jgi:hypothetical protein